MNFAGRRLSRPPKEKHSIVHTEEPFVHKTTLILEEAGMFFEESSATATEQSLSEKASAKSLVEARFFPTINIFLLMLRL